MNKQLTRVAIAAITALGALCTAVPALAQVAGGTTTVGVSVTESTQLAMGWSVKKTLLGKRVYNDAGQVVGKVQDLIIAPDRNVSYVIVGAGGFVGIGRHDVAVPVSQIQDKAGKLVMAGATKDTIKALPAFSYAPDTSQREAFIAAADKDIANGRTALTALEKKAAAAAADAKAGLAADLAALQTDLTAAEAKVAALKQATAARWKDFELDVGAATARLRKSTQKATG